MTTANPVIADIRAAIDFAALAGEYTELHASGKDLRGRCPLHGGDSESAFVLHPDSKTYHCFRCEARGDLFDFIQVIENTDFRGALTILANRAGIALPNHHVRPRPGHEQVADDAMAFWRTQLLSDAGVQARRYLASRGISEHVWRAAGVGYCPAPGFVTLTHLREQRGHTDADILTSRIYTENFYTPLVGMIVVPIKTNHRITNLYGRATVPVEAKDRHRYTGSHEGLYGIDEINPAHPVVIVEAIIDALALRSAGVTNVVATYGTSGLNDKAAEQIAARGPHTAVLFFDGDKAGRAAAKAGAHLLTTYGLTVRYALVPEGEDPASMVARGMDVLALVECSATAADIAARQLVGRFQTELNPKDRVHLGALLEEIATAGLGPLTATVVLNELATMLGLPLETLRFELSRLGADSTPSPEGQGVQP